MFATTGFVKYFLRIGMMKGMKPILLFIGTKLVNIIKTKWLISF